MLGTRRYETFHAATDYAAFAERALASLRLAEPVVAKHKVDASPSRTTRTSGPTSWSA